MSDPAPFFNRELSWLQFNQRVLNEATDTRQPLLERLRFLAITASNLDEFFMVRVGGLTLLQRNRPSSKDPTGLTAAEQLEAISEVAHAMLDEQYRCFVEEIEPGLAAENLRRSSVEQLTDRQLDAVNHIFETAIFTVATPLAVPSAEKFPLVANQLLHVCVRLAPTADGEPRFAVVPLGRTIDRVLTLPSDGGHVYVLVEDVVRLLVQRFFPGEEVEECVAFRITRNADFAVDDDLSSDLLVGMQEVLKARKTGRCVRLEIEDSVSEPTRDFLLRALDIGSQETYAAPGPLALSELMPLCDTVGFDNLRFQSWTPVPSPGLDTNDMFAAMTECDLLLHHPYDSFDPMLRLLEQAAADPDVLAIKQTLYRTSRNSPVVEALANAAKQGKYVTALVELKARFDEARNIEWAQSLEHAGAHVIYGLLGLKTHAKICLIVRREPDGVRRYVHFGTGNYNERTARLYTDISYFTSREEFGADASRFFNAITGYSEPLAFDRIAAAPSGLRQRMLEMIEAETRRKKLGQKARIVAKMNSLADPKIIQALYVASQAGVSVRLNVRGICCLRPGVPGLSENIEVVSIVDRFLEHSRIFAFHNGGEQRVFISSADWMPRNLDRRVELLVPVVDPDCRRKLIGVLETCFRDDVKSRRLLPDGEYAPATGGTYRCQQASCDEARKAAEQAGPRGHAAFTPRGPQPSG